MYNEGKRSLINHIFGRQDSSCLDKGKDSDKEADVDNVCGDCEGKEEEFPL